ncbi:MAG: hypothetical protein JXA33_20710 [Anaerolineae bacterium]|nr:hypothetical protein [Anaerolineae bacterium]
MTVCVDFLTPRQTCYAIERVSATKIDKLVTRPWNMYEPDSTTWWLVPSNNWPAYKHGKFHFNWGNREHTSIFVSLYFEKGLDSSISTVYSCAKGQRLILDKTWTWYRLIRDLENSQLTQKLLYLSESLPLSLEMIVNGGYVQDPCDFDPNAPGFNWDFYDYTLDATTQRLMLKWSRTDSGLLTALSESERLDKLPDILREFTSNGWMWVNLHFGIRLLIKDKQNSEQFTTIWSASDLWEKFFQHLTPWLI